MIALAALFNLIDLILLLLLCAVGFLFIVTILPSAVPDGCTERQSMILFVMGIICATAALVLMLFA